VESSSQYINRISREYALHVLTSGRAIPSLYDGLKTPQRIALWLMHDKASEKKTAGLAGAMIESLLYNHGNTPAEDTISYIAAPFLNNHTFFDPIGAFGTKVDPYGFASARYTSVKKSKFAEEHLFKDIDILPMRENYDGSARMPFTFAPHLPLVLLNGVVGIAVGYATTIFPRSLEQIKKSTIEYIEKGKIKTDLTPSYTNYDVVVTPLDKKRIEISGRITKISANRYRVTEVLPGMSLLKLRETMILLSEDQLDAEGRVKKAAIIEDFVDNSQKTIDVEVTFCPGALRANEQDQDVLRRMGLVEVQSENITVLTNNGVDTLAGPEEVIRQFVEWRLTLYPDRYKRLIAQEEYEALFWKSFKACLEGGKTTKSDPIPVMLHLIKDKDELKEVMRELISDHGYEINEDIIERLASLPIHRWTKTGPNECKSKIAESKTRETEYRAILKSPDRMKKIYVDEIKAL